MTEKERDKLEKKTLKYGLLQFRKVDEYLLENLLENTISLGHKKYFNDPFDCSLPMSSEASYDTISKYLKAMNPSVCPENLSNKAKEIFENKEQHLKEIESLIYNHRRFSCFTIATPDKHLTNSLFWANYADKHQGVCIKYSGELLKHQYNTSVAKAYLLPVDYTKNNNIPVIDYFQNKLKGDKKFSEYCMLTKGKSWRHEEEVRMIYYSKSTINAPYVTIQVPPSFIEEIYFGCNFNFDGVLEQEILKVLTRPKYWGIKLFRLLRNEQKFTLDRENYNNQFSSLRSE
ncbi:MAG: DUF2971 domain-containing protein [Mangrovibacterium sp.]